MPITAQKKRTKHTTIENIAVKMPIQPENSIALYNSLAELQQQANKYQRDHEDALKVNELKYISSISNVFLFALP